MHLQKADAMVSLMKRLASFMTRKDCGCLIPTLITITGCQTINNISELKETYFEWLTWKERRTNIFTHRYGGWGEFPETGRPEIAQSSIRPEEMLLLFLNPYANWEEWKQSRFFFAIFCPDRCLQTLCKNKGLLFRDSSFDIFHSWSCVFCFCMVSSFFPLSLSQQCLLVVEVKKMIGIPTMPFCTADISLKGLTFQRLMVKSNPVS